MLSMLSMLSWSKDPSWRREEKEGNWYRRMNRRYHRCKRPCTWYTTWRKLNSHRPLDEPTVCFLVAPNEWKRQRSRRQKHRMIRRSERGYRRSIRRLVWMNTETHQDEAFSTGWTDAMIRGSVGLSDGYEDAYSKGLAKRPNRRTVGA
jgi:hypothetical protein